MKSKHPLAKAVMVFGCTLAGIIILFCAGLVATAAIFGDCDKAFWGFTVLFNLLGGLILVGIHFVRARRAQHVNHTTTAG